MQSEEKYYKCIYCGRVLPFKDVWYCNNADNTGICYSEECSKKCEEQIEHDFEYTSVDLTWEELMKEGV